MSWIFLGNRNGHKRLINSHRRDCDILERCIKQEITHEVNLVPDRKDDPQFYASRQIVRHKSYYLRMDSSNEHENPHENQSTQSIPEEVHRKLSKTGLHMYEILGVDKSTATQDDIKRAYHRLALKYHPDKNKGDPKAADKFKEINYANRILSDKTKKKIYDVYGSMGLHMAETIGEDKMGAFLFMQSRWVKALTCCCFLFTGCCFGCFCCCFCGCNFCCGKFAPKPKVFCDAHDDVQNDSNPEDEHIPIITSEPGAQPNVPLPNGASADPGVIYMPYHPDSTETKPTVIAMPMYENSALNSHVKNSAGPNSQNASVFPHSRIALSNSRNYGTDNHRHSLTHTNNPEYGEDNQYTAIL